MASLPGAIARLATGQHGVISLAQCRALGVPESTVTGWVRYGWLRRAQPGVCRLAGAPATYQQDLMAAVLAGGDGAAASHRAAAQLWDLIDEAPVEIVVPRGRRPDLRGVIVHQTRDPIPTARRRGITVTTPTRALVDLAAVVKNKALVEAALDRALIDRRLTVAAVEWELAQVARRGRGGAGRLQAVLDERALAWQPPDGMLEPRFARLQRRHGLPPAVFQYEVRWRGRWYRIDFAYPDLMIAIEVDGYQHRASRDAFQHDTERQTALATLGWRVLRFTWHDVVRRPSYVAATILSVLEK